ncbi:S-methyl-5'-thioadenosine phosphorylase [Candidatus Woesearchaeota archaeon]|nr:S-methyl-5'-thioadenosine phosphorylase [Candidatus Woesearchaeota archaeon]
MIKIGIIGGSGLDNPDILEEGRDVAVDTPYGKPSSPLKVGKINGVEVVLLARHGRDHSIMPTNVNNQANIWALREQGCTHLLASTACGSLCEEIKPGDFVFVDQFIDRTTKRKQTFYESGKVCHIPMAEPFCPKLRLILASAATSLGLPFHARGTVVTIEGPRFSTRAESKMFQSFRADVINMSTVPEVVLAREAGICYAAVAMSTDYDCWRQAGESVTWEEILNVFHQNAEKVIQLFLAVIPQIKEEGCRCREDIKTSVMGGG